MLREKAGASGVRLHDLRHYVATRLLASGIDVRTVAGRLGHRNPATTLNVYAHFVPEADEEAASALADVFVQHVKRPTAGTATATARHYTVLTRVSTSTYWISVHYIRFKLELCSERVTRSVAFSLRS